MILKSDSPEFFVFYWYILGWDKNAFSMPVCSKRTTGKTLQTAIPLWNSRPHHHRQALTGQARLDGSLPRWYHYYRCT